MTCTHNKATAEALSPYTFDRGGDDTGTYTHQRNFAQRLRGVLARINARIREAIAERDLFNLREEALADDVPEEVFQFETTRRKLAGFMAWLREQLDSNYLTVVGPDRNQFLRAAYAQGIRTAHDGLSELDVAFERPDMDSLLSRPIHRTALQTLYTRTYEELESVRDDVADAVRDELVEGFREGQNPRDIARSLTDRVDSIGKHRSTLISRSEIMNAHSTSSLNRYEEVSNQSGVDIGVEHGEWATAGDSRVCPVCELLDGAVFTLREMREETFSVAGQTYRLKPPAHVQGRCAILPSIGLDTSELAPLDERLPDENALDT
jgi:SPP1 gp7 family putative phage head morphogenesis protein